MDDENIVYEVEIDPAANDRIYGHFEFLARVSETAAEKLLEGIVADIHSLENMPYRNPVYDRSYLPKGKYRHMISCERYRIVYQINGSKVYVDDIQDCRQDDNKSLLFDE